MSHFIVTNPEMSSCCKKVWHLIYCDICLLKWLLSSFVTYVVTNTDFNQFVTFCHQARCHISISSVTPGVFPIYVTAFWCYSSVTYLHMSHIVTYCHMSHIVTCHTLSHFVTLQKSPKIWHDFWWHFLSQCSLLSH